MNSVPHRRYNPLTGEWILVSAQRVARPWKGKIEVLPQIKRESYETDCYLCPGNKRANGSVNLQYDTTFVFDNDFPALVPDVPKGNDSNAELLKSQNVRGTCRVICFSPRHDLTLAELSEDEISNVIDVWAQQTAELGRKYRWVQVFENKGELMGCSNPHPHGQIWAGTSLPNEPAKEDRRQKAYYRKNGSILLIDYRNLEKKKKERLVFENKDWTVLVPFWAIWPFEVMLLPREHVLRMPDLTNRQRSSLANALKVILQKYDRLFNVSFPYSAGWHGAPFSQGDNTGWQFHAHFFPPLLRSANVKKFMVGYELLAEVQRDLTPESAAAILREV